MKLRFAIRDLRYSRPVKFGAQFMTAILCFLLKEDFVGVWVIAFAFHILGTFFMFSSVQQLLARRITSHAN